MINERIKKVQELMKNKGINTYFIPTSDYHDSEYVCDHFQCRRYMSGFTGSAGMMVITQDQAFLWADGRYYIQAAKQIKGTCIEFMKWGDPKVLNPLQFITKNFKAKDVLGFDGKVVSYSLGQGFKRIAEMNNGKLKTDEDLVDLIWNDRPELPKEKLFILEDKYTGENYKSKILELRKRMDKLNADVHIITSIDDIAYLLNLRGHDIEDTPVFLSYLIINKDKVTLYIDQIKLNDEVKNYLNENDINVSDYNSVYDEINNIKDRNVLVDQQRVNYFIVDTLSLNNKIINSTYPTTLMKAVKNDVELENLRKAHLYDGTAVTKFMYYLKTKVGKEKITEYSADKVLTGFRAESPNFKHVSFNSIVAYKDNAAMMHYFATEENCEEIKPAGMLLVDSGGQYLEGTTDITRTFAMGPVTDIEKRYFTLVLKGFIALSQCTFLKGCTGINLDILARNYIWREGIDYKCGTGHGVGYMLSVHEGPHAIKWMQSPGRHEDTRFVPGMVITNEPGIYIEGKYGIRTENMMVCQKYEENEFGEFFNFETLTYVPIDLDLIDKTILNKDELDWLNNYHKMVYEKIAPNLDDEQREWLKKYTREI